MKRSEKLFCSICNQNRKFKYSTRLPAFYNFIRDYKYCSFCSFEIYSKYEYEFYTKDRKHILHFVNNTLKVESNTHERFKLKPFFIIENISFEDYIIFCKNKNIIKKISQNEIFI